MPFASYLALRQVHDHGHLDKPPAKGGNTQETHDSALDPRTVGSAPYSTFILLFSAQESLSPTGFLSWIFRLVLTYPSKYSPLCINPFPHAAGSRAESLPAPASQHGVFHEPRRPPPPTSVSAFLNPTKPLGPPGSLQESPSA